MHHQHHSDIPADLHYKLTEQTIQILNATGYIMAEYNLRTGKTVWERFVSAPQREKVEQWLKKNYPIKAVTQVSPEQKPNNGDSRPKSRVSRTKSRP